MRYEEVEIQQLKHGDQIAVMGNVADLSSLLLTFMGFIDYTDNHHGIFDEKGAVIDFYGERAKKTPNLKSATSKVFPRAYKTLS